MIQLTIMAGLWLKEKRLFPIEIMWIIYRLRFLQNSTWKYIDYVVVLNMAPRHKLGNTFPRGARKHPVIMFMNICLIFMSINRPERRTSSSPASRWRACQTFCLKVIVNRTLSNLCDICFWPLYKAQFFNFIKLVSLMDS